MSANTAEGKSTTTGLASLGSFTWFLRLRIDRMGGENYVCELGAGPAAGNETSLGFSVNTGGGKYGIICFARVNDGLTTGPQIGVNLATLPDNAPVTVGLCVTGRKVGGRWEYKGYTDGLPNWGETVKGPTGYGNFGKLNTPYRLLLGEGFYGSDLSFADCLFWADRVLSEAEIRDAHNGAISVRALYHADQVISLNEKGVNGGGHPLARHFDTAAGTQIGAGTVAPSGPLAPMPTMGLDAFIMQSGKTILFRPVHPDGTPAGFAADTPTLLNHPAIRINGGEVIPLARPYYLTAGPFLAYPVTGPRGFRVEPFKASDRVTFSTNTAWLICVGGLTKPHADTPVANHVGRPGTLAGPIPAPPARTLKGGVNAFFEQPFADYTVVGTPGWRGVYSPTLDNKGNLTRLDDNEVTYPFTINLFSGRINWAWFWKHGPEVPFGLNTVKAGRCAVTWTGGFYSEGPDRDCIRAAGIASSGGPYASKQVSWVNITNGQYVQAPTAGGRHKFLFDLDYIPGTTGKGVPTSTPGDDFVRPSRAICCNLEWRARKAGGTGARSDMKFHPPGVDPDNPGHFNPALLSALKEMRPHAIRWIFDLEPSHQTWRDASYLRRTDDATRRLHTYPTYRATFPIVQVRDYTEGGPNASYLPSRHGGGLLRLTTATPHGFGDLPEVFHVHGSSRANLTLGDANEQWNGRALVGRRLSDTELLVNIGINSGYGVRKWLGDALTTDLGSVALPYVPNRLTPVEWIRLSNHAKAAPWVNVSVGTRPEAVAELARQVAQDLNPDIPSYWEWGNEVWNTVFQTWMAAYSAAHSMPGDGATFGCALSGGSVMAGSVLTPGDGYYFGGDGWYPLEVKGGGGTGAVVRAHFVAGKAFRLEIVAGGTGYTSPPALSMPEANNLGVFGYASGVIPLVCSRMAWLRKIVRAAYSTSGRDPNMAKVVLAGQGEFVGYMTNLVDYCAIAGFPIDTLSPATYDQFTGGWNEPDAWKSLDNDQLFDVLDACVSLMPMAENIAMIRAKLDANGYADTKIDAYEGGWESCLPGHHGGPNAEDLGHAAAVGMTLAYLPRAWEIWQTRYAKYQEKGLDSELQFYWGGDGGGYGGWNPPASWHAIIGPAMQLGRGDGSDGRFDNRTDPLGHDKTVSVIYGAMADWNAPGVAPTIPKADLRLAGVLKVTGSVVMATTPPALPPNPAPTLRPCPYCGGTEIVLVSNFTGKRGHYRCNGDGARGPEVRVKVSAELAEAAAAAWNNRVIAARGKGKP